MITKEEVMKLATLGRIEELAKLGDEAVDILIKELSNYSFNTFEICAQALSRNREKRAIDLLIEGLGNYDYRVVKACVKALILIGDPKGLDFIRIIHDNNQNHALDIGMVRTLEIIREHLQHAKKDSKRLRLLKMKLFSFYRVAFERESGLRQKLKLPGLKLGNARVYPPKINNTLRLGISPKKIYLNNFRLN
ncbi:MAG: HEAT repeat domain-containing protein [Candidatus Micrarchaeia archaeon]